MILYDIIRFRQDGPPEVIERGLPLEVVKRHCSDPATHGDDWFDAFRRSTGE